MLSRCRKCGCYFKQDDHIKALVYSTWVKLGSKNIVAMERPYDAEWVEHFDCEGVRDSND